MLALVLLLNLLIAALARRRLGSSKRGLALGRLTNSVTKRVRRSSEEKGKYRPNVQVGSNSDRGHDSQPY